MFPGKPLSAGTCVKYTYYSYWFALNHRAIQYNFTSLLAQLYLLTDNTPLPSPHHLEL